VFRPSVSSGQSITILMLQQHAKTNVPQAIKFNKNENKTATVGYFL